MMLLHQGRASVSTKGKVITELKDGDIAGEMVALGLSPVRTATITATETCFIQVLEREKLAPVLLRFPEENRRLRRKVAQRVEHHPTPLSVTRSIEVWRNAPAGFVNYVDQRSKRYVFFRNDILLKEGAPAQHLFMIMSGRAEMSEGTEIIGEIVGPTLLGERCALGLSDKHISTVSCKDICDVYCISRREIRVALRTWPEPERRLCDITARRMRLEAERKTQEHLLTRNALFENCSMKFIQCISMHLEDRLFMTGESLCSEGEFGDTMFMLVQGTLDVIIKGKKQSELHKGSIIGEIAVLGLAGARTATLQAKTVCLVQVLHRSIFMKYLSDFPREMIQFQEIGAARLEKVPIALDMNMFRRQIMFSTVSAEFMEALNLKLRRKFFFQNQHIIKEGTESNDMYAFGQGIASVEKRGMRVGELETGMAFGEMAVMGIVSHQALTVTAQTICDLQTINRWEFEELLKEHPADRNAIFRIIASMMRDDLAEITNLELLSGVPLFREIDQVMPELLEEHVEIDLARKGEPVTTAEENTAFFILLQGSATVQVGGVDVRDLVEGDGFGEIGLLDLAKSKNVAVTAKSTCLYLKLTHERLMAAIRGTALIEKRCFDMIHKLDREDSHKEVLANSPLAKHLELGEDDIEELLQGCEEVVCGSHQQILSPRECSQAIVLILSGRAHTSGGKDGAVVYEAGSCLGEITVAEPQQQAFAFGYRLIASTPCKVMILDRRVFFAFVEGRCPEERKAMLAKLETVPRQKLSAAASAAGFRSCIDRLAQQYVKAAKLALKTKQKPWEKKTGAVGTGKRLWRTMKMTIVLGKALKTVAEDIKDKSSDPLSPKTELLSPLPKADGGSEPLGPTRPSTPGTLRQLRLASPPTTRQAVTERWEAELCRDLRGLLVKAKVAGAEARQDITRFRLEADSLRAQIAKLEVAEEQEEQRLVQQSMDEGSEVLVLRHSLDAAELHVAQLREKLQQACQQRQKLLGKLRQQQISKLAPPPVDLARGRLGAVASEPQGAVL